MTKQNKYLGLITKNNDGQQMKIIDYISYNEVLIQFSDKTIVKGSIRNFKTGRVKNPNAVSVYGVGITGNKYSIRDKNKKIRKEYITWSHMLSRCYGKNEKKKLRNLSYENCTVCKEWLYFPNFFEWLHKQTNYKVWLENNYMLDKDIIIKGNKIYSPDRCCLVPHYINSLITNRKAARGKYPIGVIYNKNNHCFDVRVNDGVITNKTAIHLTGFKSAKDAFYKYKELKEKIIKVRAIQEFIKGNITRACYEALLKYKINITD